MTPEFFYTVTVRLNVFGSRCDPLIILHSKDDKKTPYTSAAHPDLSGGVMKFLEATLGPNVHAPVVEIYCSKLRSSSYKEGARAPVPKRQTPRYLHVIAAPDDEEPRRLDTEAPDSVAVLKWDVVTNYTGLTVDVIRPQVSAEC